MQNRMMGVVPFERIAIFIDGANFFYAQKALGLNVDYKRLLEYFTRDGTLLRAFYYTALDPATDVQKLVDWLQYNGYTVVTKPVKKFQDPDTGGVIVKGNVDIELAIDMLALADKYDRAVLFSGDGDLTRLVQAVQMKGVRVQVVSTLRTSPPMIADELRRQADEFIELADIAEELRRPPRPERMVAEPKVPSLEDLK